MDYTLFVCGLLGITPLELGTYLLWAATLAPFVMWAKPHFEPVLERWRVAASLTRTTADDYGVKVVAAVWWTLLLIPRGVVWATPIFGSALEAAKKGPPKRTGASVLGVLTLCILLAGALVTTTSGCATGRGRDTTPLHRASAAASVFADAGTWAHGELDRHIEEDLTKVRASCLGAHDPARDCDAEVRDRGSEYTVVIAGHTLYAQLVNQLRDELEVQARHREAGEAVDLTRASWIAGRVLDAYSAIAETLTIIGIQVPPLPARAVAALEGLR